MELIGGKEKNTVYLAVLTLAVVGLALVFSTWQFLRQQRQAGLEHMELASLALLQAVESTVRRGPMMGMGRLSSGTLEFFRELENNDDILFVGVMDDSGHRLSPDGQRSQSPIVLPEAARQALASGTRWQGEAVYGTTRIYLAARRVAQRRQHHRNDTRTEQPSDTPGVFLAVALDLDRHLAVYQGFRNTAVFQSLYTLGAAAILWILALRLISRRKLAGRAASLQRFQARLIDSLPDGLLVVDGQGTVLAANPAAQALFAARLPALAGQPFSGLGLPPGASDEGWTAASVDGMDLEIRSLPYHGEHGQGARLVMLRDRTQIRKLEKNLAQAEQLAIIGGLAAGMAHEIRNPLSALRGFAQYFAGKLAGRQPEEEYAQTMVREADRLNRVVTDLLYLSRPRDCTPVPVDLERLADEMDSLLCFELEGQGVSLVRRLETDRVAADPDAVKQAVLNLLLNSLEALKGRDAPHLALTAERGLHDGAPGVWLRVADNGPGMDAAQQAEAFKPFYSTRKKGTGLGLALVLAIMDAHHGQALVECPVPGQTGGCRVGLFFPDPPESRLS